MNNRNSEASFDSHAELDRKQNRRRQMHRRHRPAQRKMLSLQMQNLDKNQLNKLLEQSHLENRVLSINEQLSRQEKEIVELKQSVRQLQTLPGHIQPVLYWLVVSCCLLQQQQQFAAAAAQQQSFYEHIVKQEPMEYDF